MRCAAGMAGTTIPPHDFGDVRAGVPGGAARSAARTARDVAKHTARACVPAHPRPESSQRKRGPNQQPVDLRVDLFSLTVPAIRHVLWALGQAVSAEAATQALAWSDWRPRHQSAGQTLSLPASSHAHLTIAATVKLGPTSDDGRASGGAGRMESGRRRRAQGPSRRRPHAGGPCSGPLT